MLVAAKREYEDRFLYELIQNGYDAHSGDETEGEISIVLDASDGSGDLYVANKGRPFLLKDVRSISDLAQSTKDPEESIGNKGVGFKSVLRVCQWPEIYSGIPGKRSDRFEGFCFSFARPDDVLALVDGERDRADRVSEDVEPYFLPVPIPIGRQSERLRKFAKEGMASVVRLPLESPEDVELVRRKLYELLETAAPVQLFLERLWSLSIEIVDEGGRSESFERLRAADTPAIPTEGPIDAFQRHEIVDLDTQGEWFVARRRIPSALVREAIHRSIDHGQIDESWADWSRDSEVAVAVRLDGSALQARAYTYLPMGEEASAPLHGHLHAHFSTKLARTAVDLEIPLNRLLLDQAVEAAVRAAVAFSQDAEAVPPTAIVDLLAWEEPHAQSVEATFEKLGLTVSEAKVIPVVAVAESDTRAGLEDVFHWRDEGLSVLSVERLAEAADAHLLSESISGERVERLEAFSAAILGVGLEPTEDTRAEWIESVATRMHEGSGEPQLWDLFYADVAGVMTHGSDALRGKEILLGEDGRLHAIPLGGRKQRENLRSLVFFPPAVSRTDSDEDVDPAADVSVPRSLRRSLVQMNPELTWSRAEEGSYVHTRARRFFEDERLIRGYKAADLLEHVGRLLGSNFSERRGKDALGYVFRIQGAAMGAGRPIADRELGRARLRVPTTGGWIPADEAVFGPEWNTPMAQALAELLEAESTIDDLQEVEQRVLLPPGSWKHPRPLADFTEFLSRIGVRDGLWPRPIQAASEESRRALDSWPSRIGSRLDLPEDVVAVWQERIEECGSQPVYQTGSYRLSRPVMTLPGLSRHDELTPVGKAGFARLVVAGLAHWGDHASVVRWERIRGNDDVVDWPSPLQITLEEAAWVPILDPEGAGDREFKRPREAWHAAEGRRDISSFSPLVEPEVRKELERSDEARAALVALGLHVWEAPRDAASLLEHLAALVDDGRTGVAGVHGFRKAAEEAWTRLLRAEDLALPTRFPITRSGRLDTAELSSEELVIDNGQSRLVRLILDVTDHPVLVAAPVNGEAIVESLSVEMGESRVTGIDDLSVRVTAQGSEVVPSSETGEELLSNFSWLREVLALVLETKGSQFVRFGEERKRQIRERLERVRVCEIPSAEVRIEGITIELPPRLRSVLPLDHDRAPTLLLLESAEELLPSDLATGLGDLLEAPDIAGPLQNTLLKLERVSTGAPTATAISEALEIDVDTLNDIRSHIRRSAAELATLLAPVVAMERSPEVTEEFRRRSADAASEGQLEDLLEQILGSRDRAEDLVSKALKCSSFEDFRTELGLEFVAFNEALEAIGEPAIRPVAEHERAMRHAVTQRREEIEEKLRARFLKKFRDGGSLEEYVEARSMGGLEPDPAWLDHYAEPPPELIDKAIEEWIQGAAGAAPPTEEQLEPLAETRRQNRRAILELLPKLRTVIRAWAKRQKEEYRSEWDADLSAIADELGEAGLLDFDLLDENGALAAIATVDLLPADMPASLDREQLGLSEAELETAAQEVDEEDSESAQRQRSISIDGVDFGADETSYAEIARAIRSDIGANVTAGQARMAKLAPMPPAGGTSGGGGGGGGGRNRRRRERLTDSQKAAIGLAGEVAAGEWLASHYPKEFSPSCWKSSYAAVDGLPGGDDDLGYDFHLPLKRTNLHFEVKATTGDGPEFNLGESEVRFARQCLEWGSGNSEYRILFVSYALDSRKRRVDMLPNPLDSQSRAYFRFPGSGLRCAFRLEA